MVFSAALAFMGGWFWLGEVPRSRDLGDNYWQLLQAMCAALGLPAGESLVERFDWPMQQGAPLDPGREAARHSFEGFMRARTERCPARGVILLGAYESEWLNHEIFTGMEVIKTISAWDMLRHPGLKRTAWADLKHLRER